MPTTPNTLCEICGKSFYASPGHKAQGMGRFCSHTCYTASGIRNRDISAALTVRWAKPRQWITRTCEACGKEFQVYPSQLKAYKSVKRQHGRRFCSAKCANNAYARHFLICEWCGDSYQVVASRVNTSHFCSMQCLIAWHTEQHTKGPLNNRNRLGRKNWEMQRDEALKRDHYSCNQCGQTKRLHVHHIRSWEQSRDDSLENLLTLCGSCHVHLHFKEKRIAQSSDHAS